MGEYLSGYYRQTTLLDTEEEKSLEEFHRKFEFMNNILERDETQLSNGARTLQEYQKEDLEEF